MRADSSVPSGMGMIWCAISRTARGNVRKVFMAATLAPAMRPVKSGKPDVPARPGRGLAWLALVHLQSAAPDHGA